MDEKERTIWCGNLSEKVSEALLFELFLQGGPLEKVRIPKDKDGNQRRYGFVVYKHACSVPYAAALFEGTALFRRKLNLQFSQSDGNESPQPSNVDVHERALSYPVRFSGPTNMVPLNLQSSLLGSPPDNIQQLLNTYQTQLMSIQNTVSGNMNTLAKSSLMGTWNRNHPYTSSPRMNADHDRQRGSGSNYRMDRDTHKRYHRSEQDSQARTGHHQSRKYHHRRDYR